LLSEKIKKYKVTSILNQNLMTSVVVKKLFEGKFLQLLLK